MSQRAMGWYLRTVPVWVALALAATLPAWCSDHQTSVREAGLPHARAWAEAQGGRVLGDTLDGTTDPRYAAQISRLRRIMVRLAGQTRLPSERDWVVVLYDGGPPEAANVFCIGSGAIAAQRAVLEDHAASDDVTAFVLAHEMAHYLNGDMGIDETRCVSEDQVRRELEGAHLKGLRAVGPWLREAIARARRPGEGLDSAHVLTDAERAADVGGVWIVRAAGYSSAAATEFFTSDTGLYLGQFVVTELIDKHPRPFYVLLDTVNDHGTLEERLDWLGKAMTDRAGPARRPAPDLVGVAMDLSVAAPIRECWLAHGGASVGWPIHNGGSAFRHAWSTDGEVQDFRDQAGSASAIMLRRGSGTAYWVRGAIWAHYASKGGPSYLGYPTSDEYDVAGGRQQDFVEGSLHWDQASNVVTRVTKGADLRRWSNPRSGGEPSIGTSGLPSASAVAGVPVDLVFCIDSTSSMRDDIDQVKRDASALVDRLRGSSSALRLGLVTYRDWAFDHERHMDKIVDLTDDTQRVVDAVLGIVADGGGDDPEDVLDGLQRALKMDWRPGVVKLVVLMGDAPAKDPDHEGKTKKTIGDLAEAVDPAHVYALALNGMAVDDFSRIAELTGGRAFEVAEAAGLTSAIEKTVAQATAEHAKEATATSVGGGGAVSEPEGDPALIVLIVANLVLVGACVVVWQQRRRPRHVGRIGWTAQVREPGTPARLFRCRTRAIRVGRGLGNDIVLRDPRVSGLHAELTWDGRGWVVTDLGSLNGTWVNGRRVGTSLALPGDRVRVGDTMIVPFGPTDSLERRPALARSR